MRIIKGPDGLWHLPEKMHHSIDLHLMTERIIGGPDNEPQPPQREMCRVCFPFLVVPSGDWDERQAWRYITRAGSSLISLSRMEPDLTGLVHAALSDIEKIENKFLEKYPELNRHAGEMTKPV